MSLYEEARRQFVSMVDYYRWEASRCRGLWNAEGQAVHLCGLEPKHEGSCICRHCGAEKDLEEVAQSTPARETEEENR